MRVQVFYVLLTTPVAPDVFDRLMESFPAVIREKIIPYKNEQERRSRITGKALLAYALKQFPDEPAVSLADYVYSETNQPLLKGSDIRFSISHSGHMVVCAISRGIRTGIDVERIKPVKLELMKFYFDPDSWQEIIHAPDPHAAFYRHWTMREAVIKASGIGLAQMELRELIPDDHTIPIRNNLYYCRLLPLRYDYTVCLASDKMPEHIEQVALNMDDLL